MAELRTLNAAVGRCASPVRRGFGCGPERTRDRGQLIQGYPTPAGLDAAQGRGVDQCAAVQIVLGDGERVYGIEVEGVWVAGDLGHRRQFQMSLAIASGFTAAVSDVRYHLEAAHT